MKLQAAILFAVSNAQRDGGRVRDKDVSSDVSDAFADYFGEANNAFGDYNAGDAAAYDSFGDSYEAFGDLSFGDYAADYSSDVADDAGRPVEEVADDYDGKTTFEEVQNTNEVPDSVDQTTSGLLPRCFNGVGTDSTTWYAAGAWTRCDGEIEACEIKVVRRAGTITQISSKCANADSCADNALNNFNPKQTAVGSTHYSLYRHQQCRPLHMNNVALSIGPREKQNDSTCFFCVEPCKHASPATLDAATLKAQQCVGYGTAGNSQPIAASALDIFSETSLGSTARVTGGSTVTLDGLTGNYYATVTQTLTRQTQSGLITEDRLMSTIQQAQLKP